MPALLHSLAEVDPREWDRLAGDNAFATHGWLLTVERSSRVPMEPLYFVEREAGRLVASAVCYVMPRSDAVETLDHMIYGRVASLAGALGLSFLPALVCGPRLGYGWHLGVDAALSAEADRVHALMIDAMEAAARARRLDLSFAHVMDHEHELVHQLRRRRYLRSANVPIAVLDIRWPTFDAYLDHLPRRARKEFRRQMKHNRAAGTVMDVSTAPGPDGARALELFDVNMRKHSGLLFALNDRALERLGDSMGARAKIVTATKAEAMTAAGLVLTQGRAAYVVSVGVDRLLAASDYAYFQVTYNWPIATAIESDLARIYYGRGLYEVKLRRGCRLENTWMYSRASGAGRIATAAWFRMASTWNRLKLPPRARRLLSAPTST